MAIYNKFDQFTEDKAKGVYNLATDQLRVFLTNSIPIRTNSVLADITEIDYTNLGGTSALNITTTSAVQTNGTFKLILEDLVLTASGAVPTFEYVGVLSDTPTNPAKPLISWYTYQGGPVTMSNGETFTCDFNQVDGFHTET